MSKMKMSKGEKQAVILLLAIGEGMSVLSRDKAFARVDIKNCVEDVYNTVIKNLAVWGDFSERDKFFIQDRMDAWEFMFLSKDIEAAGTNAITSMALQIITALEEKTHNHKRRLIILDLKEKIEKIQGFRDPEGRDFVSMEMSGGALDKLYELIEWEWV